ncbi:hypothetical protein [Clostridium gasigenes]|uniref:Histidine kinase-, DNA gyrase B-, and HSP90-like ATPase n=1 Tax=Clostridium gasigenes TaxID=94869 RepID=A0A7X0SE56_9CLOT|nr:hypothetical protein [Clostridium gasigenes]MBB6715959.1 hypothetical protein [Clostridium gasigenes]
MEIIMPRNFNLRESLKFTTYLDTTVDDSEYIYDYINMSTVEPFGMLLISSKIRKFLSVKGDSSHCAIEYKDKDYAAHMGYFQSVNLDHGKKPGEANGSSTYIPLTHIDIKESYIEAFNKSISINEYIEKVYAEKLAGMLCRENEEIKNKLIYCISEIIRNVYEHSKSNLLCFAGQYWPTKDLVEIAILDEGEGIASTLKRNKKFLIKSDKQALRLSLKPGVTRSINSNTKNNNDVYINQGFGLYMTSKICENGGNFTICSGNHCLTVQNNDIINNKCSFEGTAIRLRLKPSRLLDINLIDISKKGQEIMNNVNRKSEITADSFI